MESLRLILLRQTPGYNNEVERVETSPITKLSTNAIKSEPVSKISLFERQIRSENTSWLKKLTSFFYKRINSGRIKTLVRSNLDPYQKHLNTLSPGSENKYESLMTLIREDLKDVRALQNVPSLEMEKAIDEVLFELHDETILAGRNQFILKTAIEEDSLAEEVNFRIQTENPDTFIKSVSSAVELYTKSGGDQVKAALNVAKTCQKLSRNGYEIEGGKLIAQLKKKLAEVANTAESLAQGPNVKTAREIVADLRSTNAKRSQKAVELRDSSPAGIASALVKELFAGSPKVNQVTKLNFQDFTKEAIDVSKDSIANIKEIATASKNKNSIDASDVDYKRFIKKISINGKKVNMDDDTFNKHANDPSFFYKVIKQRIESTFGKEKTPFIMCAMNQSSFSTIQSTIIAKIQEELKLDDSKIAVTAAENVEFKCSKIKDEKGRDAVKILLQGSFPIRDMAADGAILGNLPFVRTITMPLDNIPEFNTDKKGLYTGGPILEDRMKNLKSTLEFGKIVQLPEKNA